MGSAYRTTLRQVDHKVARKVRLVGWLTHYDWLLQLHDVEAIGGAPYLVDNKFQGDAGLKDPVRSKVDAQQWGLHCQHQPITVCGPVFADDAR